MEIKNLPSDVNAEKALLGSMLIDRDIVMEATERIKPDYFYMPDHKAIYEAMLKLNMENSVVDIITVSNLLEKDALLQKVGGVEQLMELTNGIRSYFKC